MRLFCTKTGDGNGRSPILRPTGERIDPSYVRSLPERLLADRHEFMYRATADQLSQGEKVLDVGCGEGYGTAILAKRGLSAVGVDAEHSVIEAATHTYQGLGAQFVQMESMQIPFPDNTFECSVAFHVIEHVQDPEILVREMARVVSPGGMVLITTPNRNLRLGPGERPWNRYHITEYDADSLESVMVEAFAHVTMRGVDVSEPARSVELRRVATLRRLSRLDPFNFRRFLPQTLIQGATRILTRPSMHEGPIDPEFDIVDATAQPLDLLAIGRQSEMS